MAFIGSLDVGVYADVSQATRNIQSFRKTVGKFATDVNRGMYRVRGAFNGFMRSGIVEHIGAQIRELGAMGPAEIDDLANRFEKAGMSFGGFDKGIESFGDLKEALEEATEAAAKFNEQRDLLEKRIILTFAKPAANRMEGLNAIASTGSPGQVVAKLVGLMSPVTNLAMAAAYNRSAMTGPALTSEERARFKPRYTPQGRLSLIKSPKQLATSGAGAAMSSAAFGKVAKSLEKAADTLTTMEQKPDRHIQAGINRILDANSREGFAALRANMRQDPNKELEKQGETQIKHLSAMERGIGTIAERMLPAEYVSIPGKSGKSSQFTD